MNTIKGSRDLTRNKKINDFYLKYFTIHVKSVFYV